MNEKLELKIPPLVVLFVFGVFMWIISIVLPSFRLLPIISITLAVFIALIGIVFAVAGVWSFKKVETTVNPMTPNKSSSLVDFGIYKVTRNPMYVGFVLFLVSWGVYLSNIFSLIMPIIFILYLNKFQIIPEENALFVKFGEDFERYKVNVRRWL